MFFYGVFEWLLGGCGYGGKNIGLEYGYMDFNYKLVLKSLFIVFLLILLEEGFKLRGGYFILELFEKLKRDNNNSVLVGFFLY